MRLKSDFEKVHGGGRRIADGFFSMTYRANTLGAPRLGLAVAVRAAGSAVARNRLRRIVKESFRRAQHELPAVDLVVSVRAAARDATAPALNAALALLWQKVAAQCASSPRA